MKTIQAKEMTDDQWKSFANFNDFLIREFYPQFWKGKDTDWEEIKYKHLNKVSLTDNSFSNSYYIVNENKVIAFIEAYIRSGKLYFVYNFLGQIISTGILMMILYELKNLLEDRKKTEANYNTFHERNYKPFLRIGAEIVAENLASRLLKKDIDFLYLNKIVDENKYIGNYELKLYREIPEEIYERFITFNKEADIDRNEFHPKKIKASHYSMNELLKEVNGRNERNEIFYMYMIFDKEEIAAYCSVNIGTINEKKYIEHFGNLTSVGRIYRGKGFARYLKAKMYLKINEDYFDFEYALTDTYPWNKHMYKINEELGFKPYMKGYSFRFTKEFLESILK